MQLFWIRLTANIISVLCPSSSQREIQQLLQDLGPVFPLPINLTLR